MRRIHLCKYIKRFLGLKSVIIFLLAIVGTLYCNLPDRFMVLCFFVLWQHSFYINKWTTNNNNLILEKRINEVIVIRISFEATHRTLEILIFHLKHYVFPRFYALFITPTNILLIPEPLLKRCKWRKWRQSSQELLDKEL